MKNCLLLFIVLPIFYGCTTNSPISNNPNLPNLAVNLEINLNLPQYYKLNFVSNAIYIPDAGIRGIIVFNNSGTTYNAFDAACPNQALSSCSTMTIVQDISALCDCDNLKYSLFTGQSKGAVFPLKQYRVVASVAASGIILRIYN